MFSRSRTSGRPARAERSGSGGGPQAPQAAAIEPDHAGGPYDAAQAPAGVRRLDLGSLQIPMIAGVEVRVQPGKDGAVQRVLLLSGKSTLELGVFAAPRSEPIWDEVRTDIRKSLIDDGVAAEEVDGPYGTELRARVRTKDGPADLRFVGADGPRWMVRAVFRGPAAVDPAKAGPLAECLGGLVVDRGNEARPVKEPLPLRLPADLAAKLPEGAQGVRVAGEPPAGTPAPTTTPTTTSTRGGTAAGAAAGTPKRRQPSSRRRRGPGTGSTGA